MDYITGITGGLQPPDNSTPPPPSDGPAPIWAELPPTDAVVRWDELEVWVRWLVERFRLGPLIPPGPSGWMNVLAQFIGRIRTNWADQVCGQYQHEEPGPAWPSDPDATQVTATAIHENHRLREHLEPARHGSDAS